LQSSHEQTTVSAKESLGSRVWNSLPSYLHQDISYKQVGWLTDWGLTAHSIQFRSHCTFKWELYINI